MRLPWLRTLALASCSLALAAPCAGQAQPGPTVPFDRFDAAAYVAWFRGNRGGTGVEVYRDWYSAPLGGLSFGRYWTEHVKTEVEFASTGRGRLTSSGYEQLGPGVSRSVFREHFYTVRTVSVIQSYQFRHNAWVHPFAGAGVDFDWERRRTDSRTQIFRTGGTGPPASAPGPPQTEERTELLPRAALVVGLKAYLARRAFFRTDIRASVAKGVDHVSWRFGLGLDF